MTITYYNKEIINIRKFRSEIYPKLVQSLTALEDYVDRNRLRPGFTSDAIRIIDYYNKLTANMLVITDKG